jgi:hypothetical protein
VAGGNRNDWTDTDTPLHLEFYEDKVFISLSTMFHAHFILSKHQTKKMLHKIFACILFVKFNMDLFLHLKNMSRLLAAHHVFDYSPHKTIAESKIWASNNIFSLNTVNCGWGTVS